MEALRALSELGVPVSLRAIAAAGGYNLDQVMADQDENLAMQRKLLDYKRRVAELNKMAGGDEAEGGGGGGSFSSAEPYCSISSQQFSEATSVRLSWSKLGSHCRVVRHHCHREEEARLPSEDCSGQGQRVDLQSIA